MKKSLILSMLAIIITAFTQTARAANSGYREFKSRAGRFSIETPVPLSNFAVVERSRAGALVLHIFMQDLGDRTYGVEYFDVSEAILEKHNSKELLDLARDGALKRTRSTLVSEYSIVLEGYPGREIEMQSTLANGKQVTARAHIFLVENRLYIIMVEAQTGRMSDARWMTSLTRSNCSAGEMGRRSE